jgi:hypothetical protein
MKGHSRLSARSCILLLVLVALIAAHGILIYTLSYKFLAASVATGLIALVVIKHLGLLGPLYALLRRGTRHRR